MTISNMPAVMPAIDPPLESTAATTVAMIALKLDQVITDVVKANEFDSATTINALESMGLSTATTFVVPLIEILKRPKTSALRELTIFQVQALHSPKPHQQKIVLDECEAALADGSLTTDKVTTGIARSMLMRYQAKVDQQNMRTIGASNPTRADYQIRAYELEQKLETLEKALMIAAKKAGMDTTDYLTTLLTEGA